ncbi:TonB-dependent receptor [Thermomonas sp. HDW16]|nr:TonB-dependent receptor [Thermomonas sp. HDW16]
MSAFPAFAQDAAALAQQKQEAAKTLDTLVVTAQKREEALQDVPIVVTALSQEALQDAGVRDIKDLQTLVPGLTVTSTQSEAITTARIRGIGTVGDNVGLESSVGVVIDGVYRPRNSVGFGDLGELERIEVLKGPQGTVFGKNTSAGVINVVTKRPDFVRSGDVELTFGTPGAMGFSASFNTPVGEKNAFRIYATQRSRDGFMKVHTGAGPRNNRDDYDQDYDSVRAQWRITPNDDLDINFVADATNRNENCCTAVTTVRGLTGDIVNRLAVDSGVALTADPEARQAWSNRGTEQRIRDKGLSAEVNWNTPWFGGATLTSITAARDWKTVNGLDFDFSTADILYRNGIGDESFSGFKQFSQEFRLTGATDRVDWMVGLFYANEDIARNESYRIGSDYGAYLSSAILTSINPAFRNAPSSNTFIQEVTGLSYNAGFGNLSALDRYDQNAKSIALFTNNSFHVTEAFDIVLGLRYTKEDKELDSLYSNPSGGGACGTLLTMMQTAAGRAALATRIGTSLTNRSVPFGSLPAQTQQTIISNVVGYSCLPWVNPLHNAASRDSHQELSEKEWSGTLKFAYRMNDNAMFYLSGARGYKAGGFNLDRVQSSNGLSSGGTGVLPVLDTSFPGEFVDSYELGTKTTWLGGNLLLNAALFHQTYSDFQLNSFLGTSFVVRSIPEVVSRGIDTEVLWQSAAIKGLMLQGGVTYAKTEYGDSIPGCDFVGPSQVSAACPTVGALYKLPGSQISFAPEVSASAAVTYEREIDEGVMARFNIGAKYMSEFNTGSDLDPEKMQDAYTVVNARIGVGASDRSWALELWGLNIFNKYYNQVGFDAPLQNLSPLPNVALNSFNAFPGAPATYGITFRKRF